MGYIVLNSVTFSPTPASNQAVTVEYKLASDPDVPGSWTEWDNNANVLADGTFSPPVVITGLTDTIEYTVRVSTNCGGASFSENFFAGTPTTTTTTSSTTTTTTFAPNDPQDPTNYTAVEGTISGDCTIAGSTVIRDATTAANDVTGVIAVVTWNSDEPCEVQDVQYTFAPGAQTSDPESVDVSCGGTCSSVGGTVTDII